MYVWQLIGHDASEGPVWPACSGVGEDLAGIMRMLEGELAKRTGFVGQVAEVVPRMSVFHLDVVHVATGRGWLGRRDKNRGIRWEARYRPAGPDADEEFASAVGTGAAAHPAA